MNTVEVLEKIKFDVPQLAVKHDSMSSSIYKDGIDIFVNTYLWSYLREKYKEFSVRHHMVNCILRDVYLNHNIHKDARQKEEYYPVDIYHYGELNQIKNICIGLCRLTVEQLAITDFMNYLNVHNALPENTDVYGGIKDLMSREFLQSSMVSFQSFINDIDIINNWLQKFFIHPHSDELLVDDVPTIFIFEQNPSNLYKKPLAELVESYNEFFTHCKTLLQSCSPKAIRLMAD